MPGYLRARVLVVDDDCRSRTRVAAFARDAGCDVITAANGTQALRIARDDVDVVIADVVMPHMGGLDFARRLRALRPNVKLVLMTDCTPYASAVGALVAIPLIKPFEPGQLRNILSRCLSRALVARPSTRSLTLVLMPAAVGAQARSGRRTL